MDIVLIVHIARTVHIIQAVADIIMMMTIHMVVEVADTPAVAHDVVEAAVHMVAVVHLAVIHVPAVLLHLPHL